MINDTGTVSTKGVGTEGTGIEAGIDIGSVERIGIRSWLLISYYVGMDAFSKGFTPAHERKSLSPVRWTRELGCYLCYDINESCG